MRHDEPMAAAVQDEGAILLIVLFVTTVLAVLIGVVLTSVEVNLRNSTVTENLSDKTYAADGGVEYVIQRLRQDPTACSDPTVQPKPLNNVAVTVSCTPVTGASAFGAGWAVVTTDPGPASLSTTAGIGSGVNGPTYVAGGIDLASDFTVRSGPLIQAPPPCPAPTGTGVLTASSVCTDVAVPGGQPALPCIASCSPGTQYNLVPRGPVPSYTTAGGCSIFLPGKYTAAPNFGQHNYFASGIYSFDNVGNVNVSGIDLSGGNPGAEITRVGTPACADDGDAGVSDGAGVEWILGGNSSISVTSASGTSFELFARQPAASLLEGAAGISIRSVPRAADAPAGYAPTLLPPGTNLFSIAGGSGTQVKVQGLVYSPNADIALSGTRAQKSELSGGVVASRLSFHPSDVGLGPDGIVSAVPTPAPSHQFFTISSTAQGGATKNVTTTAVIELGDGPNRSVVIDSWVTNAA